MGRKESNMIPFILKGLKSNKYGSYLAYTDEINEIFHLNLPRFNKNLKSQAMLFLMDWYKEQNHIQFDYSKAKQAMLAALRKSVYLEHVPDERHKLNYRILKAEEIKEKRIKQRDEMKSKLRKSSSYDSPSSVESGYGSYTDTENNGSPSHSGENMTSFPTINNEIYDSKDLLASVQHDHNFGLLHEQEGTMEENTQSSVYTSTNNFDFEISDSELKQCMEDLSDGIPSMNDFQCGINDVQNVVTEQQPCEISGMNNVYKYKSEILVEENIKMIILEREENDLRAESDSSIWVVFDDDMLHKIQGHDIIKYAFVGNYLQIFLKPIVNGNGLSSTKHYQS